jgi:hypothetical protein
MRRIPPAYCRRSASVPSHLIKENFSGWSFCALQDVEVFILDKVYASLPTPPFTPSEKKTLAANVYTHIWQQAVRGEFARAA